MFNDVQYVFRQQPAAGWFFVMALFWLLLAVVGCLVQFAHGHTVIGIILAVVVSVCTYIAWMVGSSFFAAARTLRTQGNSAWR